MYSTVLYCTVDLSAHPVPVRVVCDALFLLKLGGCPQHCGIAPGLQEGRNLVHSGLQTATLAGTDAARPVLL